MQAFGLCGLRDACAAYRQWRGGLGFDLVTWVHDPVYCPVQLHSHACVLFRNAVVRLHGTDAALE